MTLEYLDIVVVQLLNGFWLCDPMNYSTPGFLVLHYLPEFAQTHVHWVGDAIQSFHPRLPPSPPPLSLYQHQGLIPWSQLFISGGQSIWFQICALIYNIWKTSLFKGHKISHALGPRAEVVIWKEPGSDLPDTFDKSPREARGNWSSLWGHGHWKKPLLRVCCPTWTLGLVNTILESSL